MLKWSWPKGFPAEKVKPFEGGATGLSKVKPNLSSGGVLLGGVKGGDEDCEKRRKESKMSKKIQFKEGHTMKRTKKYCLIAVFTMFLGIISQTAGPLASMAAADSGGGQTKLALGVDTLAFGATYGEWSARW